jgi:superfamily I DNA/RNA helicase
MTGVALDKPYLSQSDYLQLGIKQSIYLAEERELIYETFVRYLNFCRENHYLDFNVLSYDYLLRCQPKYDAVVIDEIQDFTPIQLALIYKSLKNPGQFLMCGDANQIVHPNFFSWSKIKTLFYQGSLSTQEQSLRILTVNYRNSLAVTQLANQILRIKHARLGSVSTTVEEVKPKDRC